MRITLVGPASIPDIVDAPPADAPPGMGGVPVNLLAKSLLQRGHHVHLVTGGVGLAETYGYETDNFRATVVPYRRRARDRARDAFRFERDAVTAAVREVKSDIIHAHWTYEFALGSLAVRQPTVVTAHDAPYAVLGLDRTIYRSIRLAMAHCTALRASTITVVSPYLRTHWNRYFTKQSVEVIPNIVPPMMAGPSSGLRILTVGDASIRKNIGTLVRAFQIVRRRWPEAQLTVIGPGLKADEKLATELARSVSLAGVHFVGPLGRSEVADHFALATIYCHPSLEEAQPMTLLEAMSASLPIVAGAQSGGVSWTCGDGLAAELVDVRSPSSIAVGLDRVISRPYYAHYLVANGTRFVANRYSATSVSENYLHMYARAMETAQ